MVITIDLFESVNNFKNVDDLNELFYEDPLFVYFATIYYSTN